MKEEQKRLTIVGIILAIVILITAIVVLSIPEEKKIIKTVYVNNQKYVFSDDIRESLEIPISGENMRETILNSSSILVIFNGTSSEDNAYFSVVGYNTINKANVYFITHGKNISISAEEINENNTQADLYIKMKGPNTGANQTMISFSDDTIILEGNSYKNLSLAGDRLVLSIIGIEAVKEK